MKKEIHFFIEDNEEQDVKDIYDMLYTLGAYLPNVMISGEEYICVSTLEKTRQFSCLESWCKSRGKGEDYCQNCKDLLRLRGRF